MLVRLQRQLAPEPAALFRGIVQLAERIRDFEATDVQFEAFHRLRIVRLLFRKR